MIKDEKQAMKGSLILGEIGKLIDLSGEKGLIETVSHLFKLKDEDTRTAASICIGNVAIGNPDSFLPTVFALVDKSEHQEKYLFLNTIREIIIHNPKCLKAYLKKLIPLLMQHCQHPEETIRFMVAENLGRLFIHFSTDMITDIEGGIKSSNPTIKSTAIKAFKFAGVRETESNDLELLIDDLVKTIQDPDLAVKKSALESLTTIVHNHPEVVRGELELLQRLCFAETAIKPELIKEVDLGPFKHKVDNGIPIRKAAFGLIDTMLDKIPEKTDINQTLDVVVKGLDDPAEECMIQCLHTLGRLLSIAPGAVTSSIESIVEAFEKQFGKNLKMISNTQASEKAQNIMRAILRVVEILQKTPDIETSPVFVEFFRTQVLENANAKEMYEKIAATASKAGGDHF